MSRPRHSLKLHKKQAEVYRDKRRFKVVVAGRRWGKTALSRTTLIRKATVPGVVVWYVAPSYTMAKQIMWRDLKSAIPRNWVRKIHESELKIELLNGSVIQCKGADNPDSLRGVSLFHVVLDEFQDMHSEVWEECLRPTLADSGGGALIIGTPKSFNNLYKLYVKGQSEDFNDRDWVSWQFKTISSPFIPVAEISAARRDMDSRSFQQEFEASFLGMSGVVYHSFDRQTHVKKCEFNPDLPIWVGQDFNIDPMSSVIMQPQPNGEVWCIDEIFLKSSNVQEVCDELERRYWRFMDNIVIFPDPAGKQRQHARGESSLDIFRQRGFKSIAHRRKAPLVADRINSVNRRLLNADGEVFIYIDPKCKNMIRSFEQTMYKPGTPDVDKAAGEEHMADAIGYAIHYNWPVREIKIAGVSL